MKRRDFLTGAATGFVVGAGATYGATYLATRSGTESTTEEVAAPAVAKGKRELKMVTTWPKGFPGLGTGAQRLADSITAASDGQLDVKLYAAGELVPPFESFDAVSQGAADMYHAAEYYWQGKNKAFNFFTAVPLGLTANEMDAWLYWGGGQELWDELAGNFNLKSVAAGNTGVQMGGWFNREINTPEDLKGLKIRIPGLGGEVLRRLGAAAVALPGGEIFPSLQSGAIDATEWVGPWNDLAMGFYKVTRYYYWPGFHEPGSTLALGMNKEMWESLTADQQNLIKACAQAENNNMYAEYNAKNSGALDTLINQHGVELRQFGDDIYKDFANTSEVVVKEVSTEDDLAKRIYDSYFDFRAKQMGWNQLSDAGYVAKRSKSLNQ